MFVLPQNSYAEILIPKEMMLEGGPLGALGEESGVLMDGMSTLIKENPGSSLISLTTDNGKTLSVCEQTMRRWTVYNLEDGSHKLNHTGTLTSDFQFLEK